jgi:di/tripeptidase
VIAETAQMEVDVRSVAAEPLGDFAARIEAIAEQRARDGGLKHEIEIIGSRPAGEIGTDHPLVQEAAAVLTALGITPRLEAASTNANIPLSEGIPAIAIGSAFGAGIHSLKERLEISSLSAGVQQIVAMIGKLTAAA